MGLTHIHTPEMATFQTNEVGEVGVIFFLPQPASCSIQPLRPCQAREEEEERKMQPHKHITGPLESVWGSSEVASPLCTDPPIQQQAPDSYVMQKTCRHVMNTNSQ